MTQAAPTEPRLTTDDLLLLIGRLYAENAVLRAALARAQARAQEPERESPRPVSAEG